MNDGSGSFAVMLLEANEVNLLRVRPCLPRDRRQAIEHFKETKHPVVSSAEPGEDGAWCYVHDAVPSG